MSYCLNPSCQAPENAEDAQVCQACGSPLVLRSRYRAVRVIGQGGFGRTLLAVDTDKPSQPLCVIKQFFPRSPNPDSRQKAITFFQQEAKQLAALGHHPQIPDLLAYFAVNDQHYLVQEFIEGETLAALIAAGDAFDQTRILDVLHSLLPVLQFLHDRQVIHRDIKPENIIWRSTTNSYVLVDFGAAKYATPLALVQTGTVIGSAAYAAPEQVGGKATFASDLYSLGVTCLHLLTLVEPFDLFSFADDRWVWRDYLQHPVDPALGRLLDKLVARPLRLRYQAASEVLRHLQLLTAPAAASPTHTRPATPRREQPARPPTRPIAPAAKDKPISQWFAPPTPSSPTPPLNPPDDRAATAGVDYQLLEQALAAGDWLTADSETHTLMLRLMGRDQGEYLNFDDLAAFPCTDLQTLDRLWVTYSQGHFGFSVQQKIWQRFQTQFRSSMESWCDFGEAIGWLHRVEKQIGAALRGDIHEYHWLSRDEVIAMVQNIPLDELLIRLPAGCLPFFCSLYTGTSRGGRILLERVAACIN